MTLNEGRGISSGDTYTGKAGVWAGRARSTKAGASAPATRFLGLVIVAVWLYAQRRPGHQPRRHVPERRPVRHRRHRSTKAGASAPATPIRRMPAKRWTWGSSLNEGRGISPGDTPGRVPGRSRRDRLTLNEGRGISPGDTGTSPGSQWIAGSIEIAQRRAGASAPATPQSSWDMATRRPSLNEGRGISPGDTTAGAPPNVARTFWYRSTKAGASAPATRGSCATHTSLRWLATLNEGRGISPGDTRHFLVHRRKVQPRSTKAGASAPATPEEGTRRAHARPRSTKAGASAPATPEDRTCYYNPLRRRRSTKAGASAPATPARMRSCDPRLCASALNEGRGISPGDTHRPPIRTRSVSVAHAQRRPGHQPRRHAQRPARRYARVSCSTLNEGRGISPGDTYRAFTAGDIVRCLRSTKAGASAPATPQRCCRVNDLQRPPSLNEGRGISPGDTSHPSSPPCAAPPLNEGRGISPGDTRCRPSARVGAAALNEGRGISPGDTQ